jgi:hypothetical protein
MVMSTSARTDGFERDEKMLAAESRQIVTSMPMEKSTVGFDINNYVVDVKLERRLLWKFDFHILPMLAIMYLFK